jgi:hypothetical protein
MRHLIAGLLIAASTALSAETALDFWDQAIRTAVVHKPSQDPLAGIAARQQANFRNPAVTLRYDKPRVGAFSVEVTGGAYLTLVSSVWGGSLAVPANPMLQFWAAGKIGDAIPCTLIRSDNAKTAIVAKREQSDAGWSRYTASLTGSPARLQALTLDLTAAQGPILIDGVGFQSGSRFAGLTDKPLEEWMTEASETRAMRVRRAVELGTKTNFSGELRQWFDKLWLGQDVPQCNALMRAFFEAELVKLKEQHAELWDLSLNVRLIEIYYALGSKSGRPHPPLEAPTERLLLEVLWERTKDKNDIGWASSNTWWMTGSENHDLNAKVANLVSSRIFMNEPAYRDRLYPDAAHGPGHGYWFAPTGNGQEGYGPDTTAPWKVSGRSNAREHYTAWVRFFGGYFSERAQRGFFLERASAGYMKWSLGFLYTLHTYCGDDALKKKSGDFLNLVWAEWAQEQIGGVRGGAKTRHHHSVGGEDSMTDMSRFLLGSAGTTNHIYTAMLLDDYAIPAPIFHMALDSRGRGRYALISRGIGEEEAARPAVSGMERTLMCDRDSRFLKYSWVTPDYILGTQMDHPDAVHSHLSAVGRWHGLTVAGSPDTRIVPFGGIVTGNTGKPDVDMEVMYLTAQDRNVLIVQQARRWNQVSPTWFPSTPMYEKPVALYVGKSWDAQVEKAGWLFFRKGNAYAAVRVAEQQKDTSRPGALAARANVFLNGDKNRLVPDEKAYTWSDDKTALLLREKFSPIILYSGSKAEHGSFEVFQNSVFHSRFELHPTVVPGYFTVTFQGAEKESKAIEFPANAPGVPTIGGKPVDYQPQALFAGPFLQSVYRSSKIRIEYGGRRLDLTF